MNHVRTPRFRSSYPSLFKARLNDQSGKLEFSVQALFKKGEKLEVLQNEVLRALTDKFGKGQLAKGAPHPAGTLYWKSEKGGMLPIRLPFRDQGEQRLDKEGNPKPTPAGYEAGAMYVNFKSYKKVPVVDQQKNEILDESQFYAGCYAVAAVSASAYDHKGNRGVSIWLNAIQKVAEGEPLGNRVDPQTAFEAIEETEGDDGASSFFAPATA